MKKKLQIEKFSVNQGSIASDTLQNTFMDENFFVTLSAKSFAQKGLIPRKPYIISEGRVIGCSKGYGKLLVNLEEIVIEERDIMVLLPGSIIELTAHDDDFDIIAFSFKDLAVHAVPDKNEKLHLSDKEWHQFTKIVELMLYEVENNSLPEVVQLLQEATLISIKSLFAPNPQPHEMQVNANQNYFRRFLDLVEKYGNEQRNVTFYANKLSISPNHLSYAIKQSSGKTIMWWINKNTIEQAKMLLKYSEMPIGTIANQLHFANPSFFTRFFKKATGLTPGSYRKS